MNTYYTIQRAGRPHPIYLSFMSNFTLLFIAFPGMLVIASRISEGLYSAALLAAAITIVAADALTALYIGTCQALLANDDPDTMRPPSSKMATIEALADYLFWPHSIIIVAAGYALLAAKYATDAKIWAIITIPVAVAIVLLAGYTEARWGTRRLCPKGLRRPAQTDPQNAQAAAKAKRMVNATKVAGTALLVVAVMLMTRNFPMIFPAIIGTAAVAIIGTAAVAIIAAGRIPSARLRHYHEYPPIP